MLYVTIPAMSMLRQHTSKLPLLQPQSRTLPLHSKMKKMMICCSAWRTALLKQTKLALLLVRMTELSVYAPGQPQPGLVQAVWLLLLL
jgi:hypothetical protein